VGAGTPYCQSRCTVAGAATEAGAGVWCRRSAVCICSAESQRRTCSLCELCVSCCCGLVHTAGVEVPSCLLPCAASFSRSSSTLRSHPHDVSPPAVTHAHTHVHTHTPTLTHVRSVMVSRLAHRPSVVVSHCDPHRLLQHPWAAQGHAPMQGAHGGERNAHRRRVSMCGWRRALHLHERVEGQHRSKRRLLPALLHRRLRRLVHLASPSTPAPSASPQLSVPSSLCDTHRCRGAL
jgi:hypothetical protein